MKNNDAETNALLFVYGTLKRQQRNHRYLEDQEFLAEVVTVPGYALWDAGAFPCLVVDPRTTTSVCGELYAVTKGRIDDLDFHEGAPRYYKRAPVQIHDHENVQAYFYQRTTFLYGKLPGRWPREQPWNWFQKFRIAIARAFQHS